MQRIPFAQIDAFARRPFEGNQACVMPLDSFLPDETLQNIAAENNVAETAYIVPVSDGVWDLRWFTPGTEVPLCGHATLAAAHFLYANVGDLDTNIRFRTRYSGDLHVSRCDSGQLEMDFPAQSFAETELATDIERAIGKTPERVFVGPFYAALFEKEEDIFTLAPDLARLKTLGADHTHWGQGNFGCFAIHPDGSTVTSRFFAPGSGIEEDPATGSWHCMVSPLVAHITGEKSAKCFQAYPGRGAYIETELVGDRVKLRGDCVTVIEGTFML